MSVVIMETLIHNLKRLVYLHLAKWSDNSIRIPVLDAYIDPNTPMVTGLSGPRWGFSKRLKFLPLKQLVVKVCRLKAGCCLKVVPEITPWKYRQYESGVIDS